MPDMVAIMGAFLLWASVLWLPLTAYRAVAMRGRAQIWAVASCFAFLMVLMGYTRAIERGTVMEAFAWSVSWVMPVGIALFVRWQAEDVPLRRLDYWLAALAVIGFLPVAGRLPPILNGLADRFWA